ncbi:hypothetical protein ACIRS1_07220 [Kitasatospora sp. NPDC101176]|uniref:hypothetical protein n=1 Tax=Kitasatospora sp. NPDC101176 TaxID=3364099 RepID=UPI0037F51184
MDRHPPAGLAPVDSHAAWCRERGDAEHLRSIRLHQAHPERNLALYVRRIEAAGWRMAEQVFGDDGTHRRCSMRFVPAAG